MRINGQVAPVCSYSSQFSITPPPPLIDTFNFSVSHCLCRRSWHGHRYLRICDTCPSPDRRSIKRGRRSSRAVTGAISQVHPFALLKRKSPPQVKWIISDQQGNKERLRCNYVTVPSSVLTHSLGRRVSFIWLSRMTRNQMKGTSSALCSGKLYPRGQRTEMIVVINIINIQPSIVNRFHQGDCPVGLQSHDYSVIIVGGVVLKIHILVLKAYENLHPSHHARIFVMESSSSGEWQNRILSPDQIMTILRALMMINHNTYVKYTKDLNVPAANLKSISSEPRQRRSDQQNPIERSAQRKTTLQRERESDSVQIQSEEPWDTEGGGGGGQGDKRWDRELLSLSLYRWIRGWTDYYYEWAA